MHDVDVVSDHAVLRYLERVHGLDVEYFRAHIESLCAKGIAHKAQAVSVEGVKFLIRDGRVISALRKNAVVYSETPSGGALR